MTRKPNILIRTPVHPYFRDRLSTLTIFAWLEDIETSRHQPFELDLDDFIDETFHAYSMPGMWKHLKFLRNNGFINFKEISYRKVIITILVHQDEWDKLK